MNRPLAIYVLICVFGSLLSATTPALANSFSRFTRVQYTQALQGGEFECRTLESNGVYYSIEEHVFLALLRGYALDRYLYQDPGYSQRGDCPRIQWKRVGAVNEVRLEVTFADAQRIVSIWGYEISPETAVSLLQSEGFHVEFQGNTIYANR